MRAALLIDSMGRCPDPALWDTPDSLLGCVENSSSASAFNQRVEVVGRQDQGCRSFPSAQFWRPGIARRAGDGRGVSTPWVEWLTSLVLRCGCETMRVRWVSGCIGA